MVLSAICEGHCGVLLSLSMMMLHDCDKSMLQHQSVVAMFRVSLQRCDTMIDDVGYNVYMVLDAINTLVNITIGNLLSDRIVGVCM